MKIFVINFILSIVIIISGCSASVEEATLEAFYLAVEDAATPEENEIFTELLAITPDNKDIIWNKSQDRILVVTWKSDWSYNTHIRPFTHSSENESYVIWVTLASQVKRFCQRFIHENPSVSNKQLSLRLKQYLGLDPSSGYDQFVEMWVNPNDLIRPCVDPEINDKKCNLDFKAKLLNVKSINDYYSFYQKLRKAQSMPWTGLGYTYDWGNMNGEVGASEFILAPVSPYKIRQAIPTMRYCSANS